MAHSAVEVAGVANGKSQGSVEVSMAAEFSAKNSNGRAIHSALALSAARHPRSQSVDMKPEVNLGSRSCLRRPTETGNAQVLAQRHGIARQSA